MSIIRFNDLTKIRRKHENQKIVFCSGCFDLVHAGHVLFFEDCKKLGDILVAMVGSDAVIKRDKAKNRPILNEHVRLKIVDSLKPVDYTFLDYIPPKTPHRLYIISQVIENLQPDFYVINNDAWDIEYRKRFCEKYKVPLIILKRKAPPEFDKISTSKIIEKIISLSKPSK